MYGENNALLLLPVTNTGTADSTKMVTNRGIRITATLV